jgi:hypothetical protein
MSVQDGLRSLAHQDVQAPWGFEVFEQRRARKYSQRRAAVWGSALSVSILALIGTLALVTQPAPIESLEIALQPRLEVATESPALVNLSQFELTSELQDHIALLDAELSAGRVQRLPMENLRRIEGARQQLNESLQRVSYAHAMLSL